MKDDKSSIVVELIDFIRETLVPQWYNGTLDLSLLEDHLTEGNKTIDDLDREILNEEFKQYLEKASEVSPNYYERANDAILIFNRYLYKKGIDNIKLEGSDDKFDEDSSKNKEFIPVTDDSLVSFWHNPKF